MSKFKVGQECVYVNNEPFWYNAAGEMLINPFKQNEIYVVSGVMIDNGDELISLAEFSPYSFFDAQHFEPLVDIGELKEILEQQPAEV